jgi:hypothetical protein
MRVNGKYLASPTGQNSPKNGSPARLASSSESCVNCLLISAVWPAGRISGGGEFDPQSDTVGCAAVRFNAID